MFSLAINYFSGGFRHPLIYGKGDGVGGFNKDKRFYNRKTNSVAF